MSKPKTVPAAKKKTAPAASGAVAAAEAAPRKDGVRETIESIVIAFVLAFLFRAFEAEAFVIPTGSMAPTLMGVHKDLTCSKCGFPYRVSASDEQEDIAEQFRAEMNDPRLPQDRRQDATRNLANLDVIGTVCPNCRFPMDVDPKTAAGRMYPTYKGDRILVAKFPYDFADPRRWDVVVFKYPQTANENFIKRCVGLPDETVVIHGGNIFTRDGEGAETQIERKPPDKVQAIMQPVYDNDYALAELAAAGLPARWQPADAGTPGSWAPFADGKSFRCDGTANEAWLAYHNLVPSPSDWERYEKSGKFIDDASGEIPPQLVSDFYAYNAFTERRFGQHFRADDGLHWVADLILEAELTCEPSGSAADPRAVLRLIKGGQTFDCSIDVNTGKATALIGGNETASADTPIRAGGRHRVTWANVDCQLLLWVDDRLIEFDHPATYEPEDVIPTEEDFAPARVGSRGAALEVGHLRLLRDVYYIACNDAHSLSDYESPGFNVNQPHEAAKFLSTPAAWPRAFGHLRTVEFPLRADEFLMLGDNSPRSKDSRMWDGRDEEGRQEHFVKRDLLVGKAVFVYWPHSWNRVPGTRIPFPFFPNFARMKFVR